MNKHPFFFRIVTLCLGAITGLLIGELAVRIMGVAPEVMQVGRGRFQLSQNPLLGYEPRPVDYDGDNLSFYDYRGSSNDLGYRDVNHAIEKPQGVYRIVILGDSIAAGLFVEAFEDTFPAILQKNLTDSKRKVEILNFGVSGYNTRQEIETLKDKALPFRPDLVLVAYCLNDRGRVDGGILDGLLTQEREQSQVNRYGSRFLLWSALYRFVRFSVFRPEIGDLLMGQLVLKEEMSTDTVPESFAELEQLSQAHDFDVLIAVFPIFKNIQEYHYRGDHEAVAKLAQEHQFQCVDLLPVFQECEIRLKQETSLDFMHPNSLGHRCAADFLSGFIQTNYKL